MNNNKKYFRLDITEYQDYISLMADYSNLSMTKYISKLIEDDMTKNTNTYNKLLQREKLLKEIDNMMEISNNQQEGGKI